MKVTKYCLLLFSPAFRTILNKLVLFKNYAENNKYLHKIDPCSEYNCLWKLSVTGLGSKGGQKKNAFCCCFAWIKCSQRVIYTTAFYGTLSDLREIIRQRKLPRAVSEPGWCRKYPQVIYKYALDTFWYCQSKKKHVAVRNKFMSLENLRVGSEVTLFM